MKGMLIELRVSHQPRWLTEKSIYSKTFNSIYNLPVAIGKGRLLKMWNLRVARVLNVMMISMHWNFFCFESGKHLFHE